MIRIIERINRVGYKYEMNWDIEDIYSVRHLNRYSGILSLRARHVRDGDVVIDLYIKHENITYMVETGAGVIELSQDIDEAIGQLHDIMVDCIIDGI